MQEEQSGHGGQHTSSSQVTDESDLTQAELRCRTRGQKTRSLKEIYEKFEMKNWT